MPLKINLGCNLRGKIMPRTEEKIGGEAGASHSPQLHVD